MVKIILVLLGLLGNASIVANAQNKVAVIALPGDKDRPSEAIYVPIFIPPEVVELEQVIYLNDAIGKPIVWNRGWDQNVRDNVEIDPAVQINFSGLTNLRGFPAVNYNAPEIGQWGEQTYFNSEKEIFAKAVILIDTGGSTVEGGPFEWSRNRQGQISLVNIIRTDYNFPGPNSFPWVRDWIDPRPGDKVWFALLSDDERFSSNPFSFTWP
jgi:hypothetical protein